VKTFDHQPSELPGLITQLAEEGEKCLVNAEIVLGLREGEVPPMESTPAPAAETQESSPVRQPVVDTSEDEDNDGLLG